MALSFSSGDCEEKAPSLRPSSAAAADGFLLWSCGLWDLRGAKKNEKNKIIVKTVLALSYTGWPKV